MVSVAGTLYLEAGDAERAGRGRSSLVVRRAVAAVRFCIRKAALGEDGGQARVDRAEPGRKGIEAKWSEGCSRGVGMILLLVNLPG